MPITFLPNQPARESRVQKGQPVLFLDCPVDARGSIERELGTAELKVMWVDSSAAAIAELRRRDMPVLVSFSRGVSALKFITELRAYKPAIPLFAVVEPDRPDMVTEAVLAGVADVLTPAMSGARVAATIARESGTGSSEHRSTSATGPHDFYSHSAAMREACAAMTRAAATRAGVLIRGERGTGRRMAAHAIHAAETARPGRFVAVDCGAFDAQQLELELFGIATRADEDGLPARGLERVSRTSRLHEALGGTLYLQNVPDASTRVQRRLLRVLRDREVVIDATSVAFDVRCMTGADDSLAVAVQDGRVEEALYRRLSTVRVDLPPLRSRREDIPALANCFLREMCASLQVPLKMFSRSALALFAALPWTGNATELRELLRTIVSRTSNRGIGVEDVLAHVRLDSGPVTLSQSGTLRQARTRFEHEYIAAVLRQHRGRITQAAKTLGIQRTNLYRKMRTLKVAQPRVR
jgi:DNA-binding NtrC family response regulator